MKRVIRKKCPICYVAGCGCKKNLDAAYCLLDDILKRYEIK